jgi:hypothetical protein
MVGDYGKYFFANDLLKIIANKQQKWVTPFPVL